MSEHTSSLTSTFEILGPIMVGPSSSHTAGALRCAQVAASLLDGSIIEARFTLWNSFAQTYHGHGTDRALLAGMMGLTTDDKRIKDAFALADKNHLTYEFEIAGNNPALHPNTVDIEMISNKGTHATVRGESLGGGKIRISRINNIDVNISGAYCTLFVAHRDAPGALAALTNLLADAKVNIAFCSTYRTEAGGQAYSVFETDEHYTGESFLSKVRALNLVDYASFIEVPGSSKPLSSSTSNSCLFATAEELLALCNTRNKSIGAIMAEREISLIGKEQASRAMKRVLDVMKQETTTPLTNPQSSLGGFIGGEAQAVYTARKLYGECLMGNVQTNAVARAMAVLEQSASMGVIVAAPTAGSAGVVPGCVLAFAQHINASEDQIVDALYCAAAVGLLLSTNACVAGAEGGCQAEVGSAAAMAAAALVQMLGGSPEQCLHAASLALGNLLGLVCDPVGGLVEIPCQNRNAIGVSAAISSAQLALSGIKSLATFDEMSHVMLQVGHALPYTLRETALGGIAQTPSALKACMTCNAHK